MEALKVISVSKEFQNGNKILKALNRIDLSVEEGEFIAIIGTSGSGKTTLINMLGGLDYPTEGSIFINGINISDFTEEERTEFRRNNIGFVFQNYNLLPVMNVLDNIVLPIKLDERIVDMDFVYKVVEALKIEDKLCQLPHMLSGGEQQRVAIARALCTKPILILADEPTGNLDSQSSYAVMELMKQMGNKFQQTIIVVTHNLQIAAMADRIIEIRDGKCVEKHETSV